jgi:hypothetical protein
MSRLGAVVAQRAVNVQSSCRYGGFCILSCPTKRQWKRADRLCLKDISYRDSSGWMLLFGNKGV